MLHLMQVIVYMLNTLEYTEDEIKSHFEAVLSGEITTVELLDIIGMDATDLQLARLEAALPKWHSALAVLKMKQEAA
jgi:hypothetical protein